MFLTAMMLHRLFAAYPTRPSYRYLPRFLHSTSPTIRQPNPPDPVSHGAETYFVDGDDTQPNTTIYKVDATSEAAESAYEPPSGPWSRAGAVTGEYRSLRKDEPYDMPNYADINLRYSGRKGHMEDEGPGMNEVEETPEDIERWVRQPEKRT